MALNKLDEKSSSKHEDLTGRARMAKNVLFSWGSYLVVVLAGFIMPRMIDHYVGQSLLGIWDFCWSIVSYLGLTGLGLGSSVNRFVAKYRARGDVDNLRQSVSSVVFLQLIIAFVVCAMTLTLVFLLPKYFADSFSDDMQVAQYVVGLLGMSVAIQFLFDVGRGVITGCHRWDIHGFINAGSRLVSLVLMVTVLVYGEGLIGLAVAHLTTVIVTEIFRMIIAHRICPELRIRPQYFRKKHARKMLSFGGKTIISGLSTLMLFQTTNVLVASMLGPAALAVFSRPVALVSHIQNFINKFVYVLTPTVGSLQSMGKEDELKDLVITSTMYGVAFSLPMLLVLVIFGDVLLELWMGPNYANSLLISVLAIGHILAISQSSVMRVLVGMNLHGKIGLINLIFIFVAMLIGISIVFSVGWSLVNAALLIVVPYTLGNGLLIPIYGCRKLGINYLSYLRNVFFRPLVCGLIFSVVLIGVRLSINGSVLALVVGLVCGGLLLSVLYWSYLLNDEQRSLVSKKIGFPKMRKLKI